MVIMKITSTNRLLKKKIEKTRCTTYANVVALNFDQEIVRRSPWVFSNYLAFENFWTSRSCLPSFLFSISLFGKELGSFYRKNMGPTCWWPIRPMKIDAKDFTKLMWQDFQDNVGSMDEDIFLCCDITILFQCYSLAVIWQLHELLLPFTNVTCSEDRLTLQGNDYQFFNSSHKDNVAASNFPMLQHWCSLYVFSTSG